MSNKLTGIVAAFLLLLVFASAVTSMAGDSATMDEVAHLPAGYSYLTQKDMRLNPEHPPLIKDLAAFPLLFIQGIKFPSEIKDWKEDINGQWGFGYHFLYQTGNPTDKMLFWARIPMVLILILLGFYIFKWARELFGNKAGLLALFFFSFSPTFLAHGKLVTTDVGAAAGAFIATYYFIKFLKNPGKRNIIIAGVVFGTAMLCKFSLVLLVPFFAIITLVWACLNENKSKIKTVFRYIGLALLVGIIGMVLIWPVYQYHVWNYPPERQVGDSEVFLAAYPDLIKNPLLWMADKPILRAYTQYFNGLFMVLHRGAFGHTTYFLGEVSNLGWKNYFPVVYAIKVPLAFHILTIISLLYAACLARRSLGEGGAIKNQAKNWMKNHFVEFSMLLFIGIYWAASLASNLNIGVRHLLPVFPFAFLLVSGVAINLVGKKPFSKVKYAGLAILLLWQTISIFSIYPHFLAYFNELAGGPNKGYIYTVDSNLDWGQDLKRLKNWVDKNLPQSQQVYVDYFGGGDAKYYLKEKFVPWQGQRDPKEFPKGNYLAVSATFLQGGRGKPGPGFDQPTDYYQWLSAYQPVAKIGYSIFVYYID